MISVRTASRIHCSSWMRREFLRSAASRNSIAAQETSRYLRLFHRWMINGAAAAASQPSISGLVKKASSGGCGYSNALNGAD